ncbi:MAG: hypothetical protein BV457_08935 [Thermoplasmata archaeon M9B1D]|nr:MAG: hypothetical protein BV457_08935 [Thermoplasmata archaeon M9B1D]
MWRYALQKGIADCSEGRNKQLKLSTQQWKEVFQLIREEYNLPNTYKEEKNKLLTEVKNLIATTKKNELQDWDQL